MNSTIAYIHKWQEALQDEINYLKKFGSTSYSLTNGKLISRSETYNYFFESSYYLNIPIGSLVKIKWGSEKISGRIISSEGKTIIIELQEFIGDDVSDVYINHDPWELLEHLIDRLNELKKNKKKRIRIKRLMNPTMPAKHPIGKMKNHVHELVLRSKYNPVTYVWGPPGTGKTYTLSRVAAHQYFKQKRILILSHSNHAVNVLMHTLLEYIKRKERYHAGDIIRYGSQLEANNQQLSMQQLIEKQDPDLIKKREQLLFEKNGLQQLLISSYSKRDSEALLEIEAKLAKIMMKIRNKEMNLLKEAYVVGTTLAKAATEQAIYEKNFDIVIVDEASMAYVPQIAFAASLGKRIIVCGDFKQLPPIASSHSLMVNEWLKKDIFITSGVADTVNDGELHPHLFLLKQQRRMHPDISSFTNKYIYYSLVDDHQSVLQTRQAIADHAPFETYASILVNTSGSGHYCIKEAGTNSRINIWQLLLSFQMIHEAYLSGVRSIGYVTPYRAQAALMSSLIDDLYENEKMTADIISATVHRFQGSERDMMVFDIVDSAPYARPSFLLSGKESEKLINVAMTRTKGKFIHVANTDFVHHLRADQTLKKLVQFQMKHQRVITQQQIGTWIRHQHPNLRWVHARKLDSIFKDMENARHSITISLPDQTVLPDYWENQMKKSSNRLQLNLITQYKLKAFPDATYLNVAVPFPFVLIDQHILWLGHPLEGMKQVNPPYIAARLQANAVIQQLIKQLSIPALI
ncbi:DEAD/DEAH box helicase [Heyndrickxia ginsengihumi]|uniref:DEAD/DEAH box helicase n=1 Tax=Heyndrickxia ginsengihumi TaxID=363870 RepID=UPI00046FD783|nr:AAA domain-containing protein [Heyndrickxia ginsengihumi]MBE6183185.1 DNA helicase [Bacillus sp. (in: firmicutes)]MCM3023857.1 DNA2/NAM7 family helicase [Heyndrickxia ginsengihumi]